MARIPYPDIEALPEDVRSFFDRIRPKLNIYRMLPHAETSLYGFMKLGNALLFKAELDPILRELVILRVGYLSDATYEIHQHLVVARHVGVSDVKIEALQQGLLTIGFYMMVSRFLENLEVEIEPEGKVDQTMNMPPRR
jgi:alkylhydroperoxidase family enzyme